MRPLRRPVLRLLGTSALLVATALTVLPAGSGAQEPSVVGWWYRDVPLSNEGTVQAQGAGAPVVAQVRGSSSTPSQVPPTTVPPVQPPAPVPTVPPSVTVPDPGGNVPTPSQAPDGGLVVAADVTGIRAMSALRFDAPDAGGAILRLTLAQGSTPSPGVRACPALSDWQPGPDQPWSARPAHDCDRLSVSGNVSKDGTTMEWALPDTFKSPDATSYDVLLVPLGGDGTPFQVAFDKPSAGAFTVTSPAPTIEEPVYEPLPEGMPPPIDTFSADGYDFSNIGGGATGVLPTDTVQLRPAGHDRPAGGGPINRLADALENPTTRRIATLALVLLGGYAYWQSGQSAQRMPQLLGAVGGSGAGAIGAGAAPPQARGIGRFARARTERPPRL